MIIGFSSPFGWFLWPKCIQLFPFFPVGFWVTPNGLIQQKMSTISCNLCLFSFLLPKCFFFFCAASREIPLSLSLSVFPSKWTKSILLTEKRFNSRQKKEKKKKKVIVIYLSPLLSSQGFFVWSWRSRLWHGTCPLWPWTIYGGRKRQKSSFMFKKAKEMAVD